jgi:hypothetical protein
MWSAGAGADVMKRIAAPMIGGIFTSFVLELVRLSGDLRNLEMAFRSETRAGGSASAGRESRHEDDGGCVDAAARPFIRGGRPAIERLTSA